MKYKILRLLLFAALIAGGLVTVFPFVWMVLSSFKSNGGDRGFKPDSAASGSGTGKLPESTE